jgi:UDP-N-acetylmuramate-alanine ligase
MDDAERLLLSLVRDGDVVMTLGAGDVDRLAGRLVTRPPVVPVGRRAR